MVLTKPIPVVIENGPEKLSGFIMKLTLVGMIVELDKITFKAGSFVNAQFDLGDRFQLIERMRSIKHYDKFFRKAPAKKLKAGQAPPVPKMLCELHFEKISSDTKIAINKFLIHSKAK